MHKEDAVYLAHHAMDNICDMDTTLMMYAAAAVEALGWRSIETDLPELDQTVVCTDGTHRWLDMRTSYSPDMMWQGHKPTHWHPIQLLEISDSKQRVTSHQPC